MHKVSVLGIVLFNHGIQFLCRWGLLLGDCLTDQFQVLVSVGDLEVLFQVVAQVGFALHFLLDDLLAKR